MGLAGLQHHSDISGWVSTSQDREYCVWSSASVPWPAPDLFIPPPPGAILAGREATSGHVPWTVAHFPTTKEQSLDLNQGQVSSEHGLGIQS